MAVEYAPRVETLAQLAQYVNRGIQAVDKLLRREDCPIDADFPIPPKNTKQFRVWCDSLGNPEFARDTLPDIAVGGTEGIMDRARGEAELRIARTKKINAEREKLEGQYIKITQARHEWSVVFHALRTSLLNLTKNITPRLTPAVEKKVQEQIRQSLKEAAQNMKDAQEQIP